MVPTGTDAGTKYSPTGIKMPYLTDNSPNSEEHVCFTLKQLAESWSALKQKSLCLKIYIWEVEHFFKVRGHTWH